MKKQFTEVTNLVLVLTEKISSSNREANELNTVSIGHGTRADSTIDSDVLKYFNSGSQVFYTLVRNVWSNVSLGPQN